LGNSHDLSDNGNRASIHWDMVQMLTKEFGGGSIYVDDKLFLKDGHFVGEKLSKIESVKEADHGREY